MSIWFPYSAREGVDGEVGGKEEGGHEGPGYGEVQMRTRNREAGRAGEGRERRGTPGTRGRWGRAWHGEEEKEIWLRSGWKRRSVIEFKRKGMSTENIFPADVTYAGEGPGSRGRQ